MKAILLMLGALSAAIIFVGCGTAVGRATGVESSKSKIAISDSSLPKASGITEDKVRRIVQEELKKYDAVKSKSGGNLEALVAEEVGNFEEDFENLIQELRTQLDALSELEPVLGNAGNIESSLENINTDVGSLQWRLGEAERVIGEIENSNDGFQTSIQGAHDLFEEEISTSISHLAVQLEGIWAFNQDPAAASKALTCLSDLECFATLNALSVLADNNYQDRDEGIEATLLYNQLNSEGWDLHVLSEAHRSALVKYRDFFTYPDRIPQEISCYRLPDCATRIQRFVELLYEAEEIGWQAEGFEEITRELQDIDRYLGHDLEYEMNIWDWDRVTIRSPGLDNLKILFSPAHEEIIRRSEEFMVLGSYLRRMVDGD